MKRNIVVMLVIAVLLAACSPAQKPAEPVSYTIEMSEYKFSPTEIQVNVGQEVTLNLVNTGQLEHELMIGKGVKYTNNRPNGYEEDTFSLSGAEPTVTGGEVKGSGDMEHGSDEGGMMVILPKPGDTATVTFVVNEEMVGEWEMGCFSLDGVHYDSGMVGKFIVTQ